MRIRLLFLSLALVLLLNSQSYSQFAARESFEYSKGTSIDTLTGIKANGWAGPWDLVDGKVKLNVVADTALNYSNLNYAVPNVGNHLTVNTLTGNWNNYARYMRPLEKTWPDTKGQYWISFIFEPKKAPTGNTYLIVKLYNDKSEVLAIGKGGGGTIFSCGSGWPGGAGADVSKIQCEAGPVWIVTRIDMSGDGKNERTFMWIDPALNTVPDTAVADVKRYSTMNSGFNNVAIEFGGEDANLVLSFDEIRLGTSFADVSSAIAGKMLATESFKYAIGTKFDKLGAAGDGWAGPWEDFVTSTATAEVSNKDYDYTDLNYEVSNVGNHITTTTTGAWSTNRWGRYLDQKWPDEKGKVYWVSALMELWNDATTSSWCGVGLYVGATEGPLIGKGWGDLFYSIGSGAPSADQKSTTKWDAGPVWLVAKLVMSGDGNKERMYLWISPNPKAGMPDTAKADVKTYHDCSNGFDRIVIHYGGELVGIKMSVDEVRLGTSWDDVSSPLATKIIKFDNEIPNELSLAQNYPNPFNPITKISYSLKENAKVKLAVYDLLGKEIAVLINEDQSPGVYEIPFDASKLSSGVYFYQLQSNNRVITKKMSFMK